MTMSSNWERQKKMQIWQSRLQEFSNDTGILMGTEECKYV